MINQFISGVHTKNKQLKKYMKKVFIFFFLAIGLPVELLINFYLSKFASRELKKESQECSAAVNYDMQIIDAFLKQTMEFIHLLDRSNLISDVQNMPYEKSAYSYRQLLEILQKFSHDSDIDLDCDIYIARSNKILSTQKEIESLKEYDKLSELQKFLDSKNKKDFIQQGSELRCFFTFPKYYLDDSIVFVFSVNLEQIIKKQSGQVLLVLSKDGKIFFVGSENIEIVEQLYSHVKEKEEGSFIYKNDKAYYKTSSYSNLVYARIVDRTYYNKMTAYIRLFFLVMVFCSLICIVIIAYYAMKFYTKPVKKFFSLIEEFPSAEVIDDKKTNFFTSISDLFTFIWKQNQKYREIIQENQKIVKDKLICDLLLNRLPIGMGISEYLKEKDIPFSGKSIVPILIIIKPSFSIKDNFRQISEMNILVKQVFEEEFFAKNVLLGSCLLELNEIALLAEGDTLLRQEEFFVENTLTEIADRLQKKMNIKVKAVSGYQVENAEELYQEFLGIRKKIYQEDMDKRKVITIKNDGYSSLQLSSYLRTTLLNAIYSGEKMYVQETLNKVFDLKSNISDKNLAENYIFSVVGSVCSHLFDSPIDNLEEKIDFISAFMNIDDQEKQKKLLTEKFLTITECFGRSKSDSRDNVYVGNAKKYVSSNIGKDISLTDIAEHVGVNVSYFSRIFKENTGETPLAYITRLRIEYAKELLLQEQLTVKEIAQRAGYSDSRNFTRVFKKSEGCTPSEYREKFILKYIK